VVVSSYTWVLFADNNTKGFSLEGCAMGGMVADKEQRGWIFDVLGNGVLLRRYRTFGQGWGYNDSLSGRV
jgi:hypothetical protein